MKKKSSKVQVNVPLDPGVARVLLIWGAYQGKTRGKFIEELLQDVARAIGSFDDIGVGTIEIRVVREID